MSAIIRAVALGGCETTLRNELRVARVTFSELFTDAAWSRSRMRPLLFESPDCVSFQFDATLKANYRRIFFRTARNCTDKINLTYTNAHMACPVQNVSLHAVKTWLTSALRTTKRCPTARNIADESRNFLDVVFHSSSLLTGRR